MDYVRFFRDSERTIQQLHARIHETLKRRDTPKGREVWSKACSEFHSRYTELAFPGGYESALARLKKSDPEPVEAALVFLELRPYFFRSGYMRETLLRRLKHVPLSNLQAERFARVQEAQRQWRLKAQTRRSSRPARKSRAGGLPSA